MSNGERVTDIKGFANERKHQSDFCPLCGKRAMSRFLDHVKKLWVYKHQKRTVKKFSQWQTVSYYHEAAR